RVHPGETPCARRPRLPPRWPPASCSPAAPPPRLPMPRWTSAAPKWPPGCWRTATAWTNTGSVASCAWSASPRCAAPPTTCTTATATARWTRTTRTSCPRSTGSCTPGKRHAPRPGAGTQRPPGHGMGIAGTGVESAHPAAPGPEPERRRPRFGHAPGTCLPPGPTTGLPPSAIAHPGRAACSAHAARPRPPLLRRLPGGPARTPDGRNPQPDPVPPQLAAPLVRTPHRSVPAGPGGAARAWWLFRWFERRTDPSPPAPVVQPPRSLYAFCRHYTRGTAPWPALMAVLTTAIAITEVSLYAFTGSIVDRLSSHTPATFLAEE